MQIVDANVLLYAVNEDCDHHEPARKWLDDALASNRTVGFAWVVLLAFIRIGTKPGLFPKPLNVDQAVAVVEHWLDQPAAILVNPTPRHVALLNGLLQETGVGGNRVTDAHLAALASEHGAEIVSYDTDFARFPGIRYRMPGC